MRLPTLLLAFATLTSLFGCDPAPRPLPFPTSGQHDLVVLMAPGPLTYSLDDQGSPSGLEYDLIQAFAQELGVSTRVIVAPAAEIPARLERGEAHFAAAWASPRSAPKGNSTPPVAKSRDILVQHEASLPADSPGDLAGREVHVLAASRQADSARRLAAETAFSVVERSDGDAFALLEDVAARKIEFALVDSAVLAIALQFVPSLQTGLELDDEEPVVWLFGAHPNPELMARTGGFLKRAEQDGTLARIKDRYLGHVRRHRNGDIRHFLERMESVLPRLRRHFIAAQGQTGIDWRLLAALAYHESQWEAEATSPTGVRGIMMLTEDTADRLGVENRLDPRESILAGARYLGLLRDQLPPSVSEPDRTWQALAAYNLGPGHFNAGRSLARQLKADADSWYEMKRILPLLAQPKYYERLKSGRARGGEAVILVENIRSYYDILLRHEPARFLVAEAPEARRGSGIKPPAR